MKIRHKRVQEPHTFPVLEESPGFYLVSLFDHIKALSKADYEPVPAEPVWEDVTSECHILPDGSRIWHGDDCIIYPRFGYRLRKHMFDSCKGIHSYMQAFIIERRMP